MDKPTIVLYGNPEDKEAVERFAIAQYGTRWGAFAVRLSNDPEADAEELKESGRDTQVFRRYGEPPPT